MKCQLDNSFPVWKTWRRNPCHRIYCLEEPQTWMHNRDDVSVRTCVSCTKPPCRIQWNLVLLCYTENCQVNLNFASPCFIIHFKWINQLDAAVSQVYYLTFMYSSTCFWRPYAHHQELNNCSSSLWFYHWSVVVAVLLVVVGPVGHPQHVELYINVK
jgi:hypothetical protein